MTAAEYRSAIETLGFTQEGLAIAVGASPRTGQKWALGETRIPGPLALLLRLLLAKPELVSIITAGELMPTRSRAPAKRKAKRPGKVTER
jgi:hypothetical protein